MSHHGCGLFSFILERHSKHEKCGKQPRFYPEQLYEALTGPGLDSYTAIGGSFVPECSLVDNSVHTSVPLESSWSFVP